MLKSTPKSMRNAIATMSLASVMVLSACSSGSTDAGPAPTASRASVAPSASTGAGSALPSSGPGAGLKACEVTGVGGLDDKNFSTAVWTGVQDAAAKLGIDSELVETTADAGYGPTLAGIKDRGCSVIVTVGTVSGAEAADATLAAANANPELPFSIVDYSFADGDAVNNNIQGQVFKSDEAAFLAGYLAAGMTKTGVVGTYGGIAVDPVTEVMSGYYNGVQKYNEDNDTKVEVLGWDPDKPENGLFAGNLESTDDGTRIAKDLVDQGADIILPVAGPLAAGSAAAAQELGPDKLKIIGLDTDQYVSDEANRGVYLTSVLKNPDVTTFDVIKSVVDGTFEGGVTTGTLENGGVSLAPFHDFDSAVPKELKAQLSDLTAAIIDGTVSVNQP